MSLEAEIPKTSANPQRYIPPHRRPIIPRRKSTGSSTQDSVIISEPLIPAPVDTSTSRSLRRYGSISPRHETSPRTFYFTPLKIYPPKTTYVWPPIIPPSEPIIIVDP